MTRCEFLLDELWSVLCRTFKTFGIEPTEDLATHTIKALAEHLGGQEIYLPRGDRLHRLLRDKEILTAHQDGKPLWELARQHRLSTERIRQILRKNAL